GERCELTDGMADDIVRLDPALANRREHGERRRDECRLLDRRVDELFLVAVEAQALEVEPGCAATSLEDLERLGNRLRDVVPHARLDRALAGEAERDLVHERLHTGPSSFVQR